MSNTASQSSGSILWKGKPWILPGLIARTAVIIAVAVVALWLEFFFQYTDKSFLGLTLTWWTAIALMLVWIFSLAHLLLLRASNTYILRNDSLEIRTGILTSQSFIIAASGFADMEVKRSVSGRIMNVGDIIIRSQSETSPDREMERVRDPLAVAEQIRQVMAEPAVRIMGKEPKRNE
jgi:uncharacterized membrane protein YdbT with pleckstrin-like domain